MDTFSWKAVLLDIDGTLLDSNDAHTRAWVQALGDHGHHVSYEQIRPMIGKGGDKLLLEVVGLDDESDEGKAISKARLALFRQELPTLRPTPGARDLLERWLAEGRVLTVATSAGDELGDLLEQAGVADLIRTAAGSSDAEASKPDPDIVSAALQKAGVDATQAVMLGDTPFDIEAARAAGVPSIVLRCGGWWKDSDLGGALAIFDDPADLLAHLGEGALRV